MKTLRMPVSTVAVAIFVALTVASHSVLAGVSYLDPGWDYSYEGTFNAGVGGLPDGFGNAQAQGALDGTWRHDQGSKWDGTAPGDPLSNPGGPVGTPSTASGGPAGTSPGGAAALLEGDTNYLRIQDVGNPDENHDGDHGWCQGGFAPCPSGAPTNTNRRVYFGHNINTEDFGGGISDELIMTRTGVTISFRARIPTTGPLDDKVWFENGAPTAFDNSDFDLNLKVEGNDFLQWQRSFGTTAFPAPAKGDGNANADNSINAADLSAWEDQFGNANPPGTKPWFEDAPNGRGRALTNGRGLINVVQNSGGGGGSNTENLVGFGLVTSTDVADLKAISPLSSTIQQATSGGLIMNNLNGDFNPVANPQPIIDSVSAGGGTLNLLPRTDSELNGWEEYWITLENNGGIGGNIEVNVYMNGSLTPTTFQVTLAGGNNAVYADSNDPFLEFGISDNGGFGSLDLDFLSYKIGVITPTAALAGFTGAAVPEPSSVLLLSLGCLGLLVKRHRRFA